MPVTCYMLDPTDRVRLALRRYRSHSVPNECPKIQGVYSYHNERTPIGEAPIIRVEHEGRQLIGAPPVAEYAGDPRWPSHCSCGYEFVDTDARQVFIDRIYTRRDTGAELVLDEAEPGAMWDADWYHDWMAGPDGRSLCVILPNRRQWFIDGPASNCTNPTDREHRCWLRTGEPPMITVSKSAPGQKTCSAGGGSIGAGDYHGFLINGQLS